MENKTRKRKRTLDESQELAYHLYADMIHDHGYKPFFQEIVGKLGDFQNSKTKEDDVLNYFINKDSYSIRKSARLLFTTTETTALFQGTKKHAVLFSTANNTIGVVHDNGSKIFKQLDTRNLITFGSVLDQAGKPISPADEPVYYDGYDEEFRIPAAEYGFAPSALLTVIISNFKGGAIVNCVFEYENGRKEDAIAMKKVSNKYLKNKPINSTDIDRAGYFTSIAEIESLDGYNNRETLKKYYMGKALGDIMLVASISPSVGQIQNPFIPAKDKNLLLRYFKTNEISKFNILHYVLKTTDRLNYVRAVIKGVHSILQVMPREGNEGYYEFFPGMIENESIRRSHYISMISELAEKANVKYNALIRSFDNSLDNGALNPVYSMFHKQLINGILPRSSIDSGFSRVEIAATLKFKEEKHKVTQQKQAGDLISSIINALNQIKLIVSEFFRQEYTKIRSNTDLTKVSNTYSKLCDIFNCLTPQRTEILHNGSMIMDIIVIKIKQEYVNLGFNGIYRIQLYNAFKAIGENRPVPTLSFLSKVSNPMVGGAKLDSTHEYYDLFKDELMALPFGTDETYEFINPKSITLIDHYPLLMLFMKFVGKDSKQSCNLIWNAYRRRFSYKIFDHDFLRRTCNEMLDYVRAYYGEEDYYRIESTITVKEYTNIASGENNKATPATLLFNAFTFHINAQNARLYGFLTDESIGFLTDKSIGFLTDKSIVDRKPICEDNELSDYYENLSTVLKEAVYNIENSIPTSPIIYTNNAPFINKAPSMNTPPRDIKNRTVKNKFSNSNSNINLEVSSFLGSQEPQTQELQIPALFVPPGSRLSIIRTGKASTSPEKTSPLILVKPEARRPGSRIGSRTGSRTGSRPGSRPGSRTGKTSTSPALGKTSPSMIVKPEARRPVSRRPESRTGKTPTSPLLGGSRNKTKRVRKSLIDV